MYERYPKKIYEILAKKIIAQASKKLQKMKTTGHMTHENGGKDEVMVMQLKANAKRAVLVERY